MKYMVGFSGKGCVGTVEAKSFAEAKQKAINQFGLDDVTLLR